MGTTPSKALHKAAKSGDTEGIESALRSGAPLDAVEDGRTPLMTAAKSNKPEILSLLLAKGASDYRDSNQELALHHAARAGSVACAAVLINRGSDHFAKNTSGQRPIHVASSRGKTAVVRYLEAATCPFFHEVQVKFPIFMSLCTWHERWLVVHRACPHDNPIVSRNDTLVYVYTSYKHCTHYMSLRNAAVHVLRTNETGSVIRFDLLSSVTPNAPGGSRQADHAVSRVQCRAPIHVFEWLRDVLHPDFGAGRGPRIDPRTHRAILPPWALRHANGNRRAQQPNPMNIVRARARAGSAGQAAQPTPQLEAEVVAPPPLDAGAGGAAAGNAGGAMRPPVPTSPEAAEQASIAGYAAVLPSMGERGATALFGAGARDSYNTAAQGSTTTRSAAVAPAPAAPARTSSLYPALDSQQPALAPMIVQPASPQAPAQGAAAGPSPRANVLDVTVPEGSEEPPPALCCVLTMDLYQDPVVAADGHTYDREAIETWLATHNTSPKTNETLQHKHLIPNHAMRGQVLDWVDAQRAAAAQAAPAAAPAATPVPAPEPEPLVPDKLGYDASHHASPVPVAPSAPPPAALDAYAVDEGAAQGHSDEEGRPAEPSLAARAAAAQQYDELDILTMDFPSVPQHSVQPPRESAQAAPVTRSQGTYAVLD